MKSVLLHACETWLVTNEIQRKIQTFVNRCLRYILRIWWPNIISNKYLWKVTGQEDINLEIRKRKFRWIVHTLTFKNRASYIEDGSTATIQMLHFIYFFSTNISTEYFKHAARSPFFSSKCRLFHNATFFGSCIIHILHTECAKI